MGDDPKTVFGLHFGVVSPRTARHESRSGWGDDPKTVFILGINKQESILELCNETMDLNVGPA